MCHLTKILSNDVLTNVKITMIKDKTDETMMGVTVLIG